MTLEWHFRALAFWLGRKCYRIGRLEPHNSLTCSGEFDLQENIIRHSTPPFVFVDVGANLGDWSSNLIKLIHSTCRLSEVEYKIILIEPIPSSAQSLGKRFEDLPNVFIENLAAGRSRGTIRMTSEAESPFNAVLDRPNNSVPSIQVPLDTVSSVLDKYIDTDQVVNLVKIDAEGYDFEVIQGLEPRLANRSVMAVQFEYNHRWLFFGHSLRAVCQLASAHGYSILKIVPQKVIRIPEWHPELDKFWDCNYLLLDESRISLSHVFDSRITKRGVWRVMRS